jgi:hypothetical protein
MHMLIFPKNVGIEEGEQPREPAEALEKVFTQPDSSALMFPFFT